MHILYIGVNACANTANVKAFEYLSRSCTQAAGQLTKASIGG